MEEIKIGVVGLGHRGRYMAQLVQNGFPFVKLTAACDVDPALWHKTQWRETQPMKDSLPNARFYEDYSRMLAEEPKLDFILVETGADVHADFCIQALQRDINVFSDIPSVATLGEAARLWEAEQNSKARLMTGANPNEWGFINAMVDLYQKGLLGEPYYMEAEYIHCNFLYSNEGQQLTVHSPWRKTLPPIRYCTHSLGPLLRILKEDLRYAVCMGTGSHIDPENDQRDDMMAALFQTESGVVIRLLRNGKCRAMIGAHSYRVFGTNGYFERIGSRGSTPSTTRFNSYGLYGASTLTELPIDMMPHEYEGNSKAQGHGGADYALFDHMFQACQNHQEFPITLREGLRMTLPGIYAAESARRHGEKLTIHYPWEKEFQADIREIDPK